MLDMRANTTWDTLRAMWVDIYLGPPDVIITDAGTNFNAEEFVQHAQSLSIEVQEIPVEAHCSIGKVERYHGPIRRGYEVITVDLRTATTRPVPEHILQMAVKVVNDTAGPNGLVPTLLVFGAYPRISKSSPPAPSILARAAAMQKAMTEVRKLKAKRQVAEALATRNGPDEIVAKVLEPPIQNNVKAWRENKGWTGPHTLIALNTDRTAVIVDVDVRQATFRITSVQPYYRNKYTKSNPHNDDKDHRETRDDDYISEDDPRRRRRGRPKGSKNKPKAAQAETYDANLAQREQDDLVLSRKLRANGKITMPGLPFELSTKMEIESLIAQGVFRFETYSPHKHGGNRIFKSHIVNEVKGKTTTPYEKSRLVIQGYADDGKKVVLTHSPTI